MKYKLKVIWYHIEVYFAKFLNVCGIEKSTADIPEGMYCYKFDGRKGVNKNGHTWYGTKTCKYYRSMKYMDAACTYVGFIGTDACLGGPMQNM